VKNSTIFRFIYILPIGCFVVLTPSNVYSGPVLDDVNRIYLNNQDNGILCRDYTPEIDNFQSEARTGADIEQWLVEHEYRSKIRKLNGHSKVSFDEIFKNITTLLPIYMAQSTGKVARVSGMTEDMSIAAVAGLTNFIALPGLSVAGGGIISLISMYHDRAHQKKAENVFSVFHGQRINEVAERYAFELAEYFSTQLDQLSQKSAASLGEHLAYTAVYLVKSGELKKFVESRDLKTSSEEDQVNAISNFLVTEALNLWKSELIKKSKSIFRTVPDYELLQSRDRGFRSGRIDALSLLMFARTDNERKKENVNVIRIPMPEPSLSISDLPPPWSPPSDDGEAKRYLSGLMSQAIKSNDIEKVKTLMAQGTNLNIPDKTGLTPLAWAAKKNNVAISKIILDSNNNWTPLYYATVSGNKEIVEQLLNKNAKVTVRDRETGKTLLQQAILGNYPDIANILLKHGVEIEPHDADLAHENEMPELAVQISTQLRKLKFR
jgi:hypothetical protein